VLADLSRPWIKVYVPETKIGLVRIGDTAEISTDSFAGKKFKGKVVTISNKPEFTPKTIQTKEERVKLVFAVKVSLENSEDKLKPGMPADAVIFTRSIK
jgi:HlyD family secretion protein